jgi:hypothetical protein
MGNQMPKLRSHIINQTVHEKADRGKSCLWGEEALRGIRAPKFISLLVLVVSAWLILTDPAWSTPSMPPEFMPVDEIRPGMTGEGRTVFKGYDVETFNVEILGVDHFAMAGSHMILAKLEGPYLEQHGVVAGMSGSPVFIDGRLIGAVAYGWTFSYAPYAGITPIENMWEVWNAIDDPDLADPGAKPGRTGESGFVWDWEKDWQAYRDKIEGHGGVAASSLSGFRPTLPAFPEIEGELRPIRSPVFISSASPRVHQWMGNFLGHYGLDLMTAGSLAGSGGGSGDTQDAPDLTHGSALGVPFITGDLSMGGVGTVTWVDKDRLIAFGHPMMFLGGTRMPMAHAWVFGFMQSYMRSFKLSEMRDIVGTIVQDRLFAIAGVIGEAPPTTRINVKVYGAAAARKKTYQFDAIRNPDLFPVLFLTSIMDAYSASVAEDDEVTVKTRATCHLSGGRTVNREVLTSVRGNGIIESVFTIVSDVFMITNNPYQAADIERVDVDIQIRPGYSYDSLVNADTNYRKYRPGEDIRIDSRWSRWHQGEFNRQDRIRLPEDLDAGSLVIHIADSRASRMINRFHHPGRYRLRSFDDIIDFINLSNQPQDQLDIFLFEPALDIGVSDNELTGLPASVRDVLNRTVPMDELSVPVGRLISRRKIRLDRPIFGSRALVIEIDPQLGKVP